MEQLGNPPRGERSMAAPERVATDVVDHAGATIVADDTRIKPATEGTAPATDGARTVARDEETLSSATYLPDGENMTGTSATLDRVTENAMDPVGATFVKDATD